MESQLNQESQVSNLSQALERMQNTLLEKERNGDLSLTQQHGYTKEDGKLITQSTINQQQSSPQENRHGQAQGRSLSQNTSNKPSWNAEAKLNLAKIISISLPVLKKWGTTPSELEAMVEGYATFLSHLTIEQVATAWSIHMLKGNEAPTPAQIEEIINPPAPKPDWSAYHGLKHQQKQDMYLTPKERKYISWCESYAVDKKNNWDDREDAREQVSRANRREIDYD